ncbi:MAG: hypothetical protein L3K02_00265 [Thermoplasmata archaeon]|nr:hypothetical protein [Thermoplasmata archaeon]
MPRERDGGPNRAVVLGDDELDRDGRLGERLERVGQVAFSTPGDPADRAGSGSAREDAEDPMSGLPTTAVTEDLGGGDVGAGRGGCFGRWVVGFGHPMIPG